MIPAQKKNKSNTIFHQQLQAIKGAKIASQMKFN